MGPSNMLELQKLVLENVSGNKTLFEKELRKSLNWLGYDDLQKLYIWTYEKFSNKYGSIIEFVLNESK